MLLRRFSCCLPLLFAVPLLAQTPNGFSRVYGVEDADIATPKHVAKAASDVVALQCVIDFVRMSGVSAWKGFSATGTVTFAGATDTEQAALKVLGSDKYRLDVQNSGGLSSTVLSGQQGMFQSASAAKLFLSSDIAALGVVVFPRLLSSDYPLSTTVISDQGSITVRDRPLHRITLDDPSSDGTGTSYKTVDLYLDPTTKQLIESVALVHLASTDPALYILETTYEDYRSAGSGILPYRYTQSINGSLQWTLQLNQIDLSSLPPTSIFEF